MLFFYCFDYKDNEFDDIQRREDYATHTVERIEVVNDVVKAEEAQRIGKNKAQKHDCVSMFVVGKPDKFFCARHRFLHSVTDYF